MQSIGTKVDYSSTLSAAEFNSLISDLSDFITTSGQSLSAGDLYQFAKAAAVYSALSDYYTDSGTANAYIVANTGSLKGPIAYTAGMRVRFKPGNTNTTASTINVNSLGVKNIKTYTGSSDVAAGDLTAGIDVTLVYDGTNFRVVSNPTVIPAGTVIQVKQTVLTTEAYYSVGASSNTPISGLSVSITPSSTSNKILVMGNISAIGYYSTYQVSMQLQRNGSDINKATSGDDVTRWNATIGMPTNVSDKDSHGFGAFTFLDSPASTSAVTYSINLKSVGGGNTVCINKSSDIVDYSLDMLDVSSITVMEVKG